MSIFSKALGIAGIFLAAFAAPANAIPMTDYVVMDKLSINGQVVKAGAAPVYLSATKNGNGKYVLHLVGKLALTQGKNTMIKYAIQYGSEMCKEVSDYLYYAPIYNPPANFTSTLPPVGYADAANTVWMVKSPNCWPLSATTRAPVFNWETIYPYGVEQIDGALDKVIELDDAQASKPFTLTLDMIWGRNTYTGSTFSFSGIGQAMGSSFESSYAATSKGTIKNRAITVSVTPGSDAFGKTGNLYIAARYAPATSKKSPDQCQKAEWDGSKDMLYFWDGKTWSNKITPAKTGITLDSLLGDGLTVLDGSTNWRPAIDTPNGKYFVEMFAGYGVGNGSFTSFCKVSTIEWTTADQVEIDAETILPNYQKNGVTIDMGGRIVRFPQANPTAFFYVDTSGRIVLATAAGDFLRKDGSNWYYLYSPAYPEKDGKLYGTEVQ